MGNSNAKELNDRKLAIKNRFLQQQVSYNNQLDPSIKHAINNVKKNRTYTNIVFSGASSKGLTTIGVLDYLH